MTDLLLPGWAVDPCPPPPLVLAADLGLPPGAPVTAPWLVGDVHVTSTDVAASHRARALALLLPTGHGVLVRTSAAWVWSGDDALRPRRVDVAVPDDGPLLPGPRPAPGRHALPVLRTRWMAEATWTLLGGVALTGPHGTAAECVRLLPVERARTCLQALARSPGLDPDRLLAEIRRNPRRPGTRQATALLEQLRGDPLQERVGHRAEG